MPPHAIRSEGVGPYLLGARLNDILALLPRGPRVVLMEIDRLVEYSLVEAEKGSVIIGVERPGVSFVTVLDSEIARTESGVGVGTSVRELREAMGPESQAANRLRDPRIFVFERLPNARFVVQEDRVIAVLVGAEDRPRADGDGAKTEDETAVEPLPVARETPKAPPCAIGGLEEHEAAIRRAARLRRAGGEDARVVYGCYGGGAVALVHTDRRIALVSGEPGKFRRTAVHSVDRLTFAGPIDIDGDGRHEICTVAHDDREGALTVHVDLLRSEGGRLVRIAGADAYRVSAVSATWIGARLDQIDLLLDMRARFETLHFGGLYVQRSGRGARNVAPLLHEKLTVRPRRPPPAGPTAGAGRGHDGGAEPGASPGGGAENDAGATPRPKGRAARGRGHE